MVAEPCSIGRDNSCLIKEKRNIEREEENVTLDIYTNIYIHTHTLILKFGQFLWLLYKTTG